MGFFDALGDLNWSSVASAVLPSLVTTIGGIAARPTGVSPDVAARLQLDRETLAANTAQNQAELALAYQKLQQAGGGGGGGGASAAIKVAQIQAAVAREQMKAAAIQNVAELKQKAVSDLDPQKFSPLAINHANLRSQAGQTAMEGFQNLASLAQAPALRRA